MKKILFILFCLSLVGCVATTSKTVKLQLGMTKPEVIKVMGNPTSVKAKESIETLEYLLYPTWSPSIYDQKQQYWVILRDGRVIQYGNAGDFGSALPEKKEYDIKIQDK